MPVQDRVARISPARAVRVRPTLYVGPLDDPLTPSRLVIEAACESLTAACQGLAKHITVSLYPGGFTIEDDSPGWSTAPTKHGPLAEMIMTQLFACRDLKPEEHRTLCTVGITVVNALSSSAHLEVFHEGHVWTQSYKEGDPTGPLQKGETTTRHGIHVSFHLDSTFFGSAWRFNPEFIIECLRKVLAPEADLDVRYTWV